MSYKKPGYYLKPYGAYIPSDAMSIVAMGAGWEAHVGEAVKSFGREARPLNSLTAEDVIQMNTLVFPTGTPQTKTFQRLLLTILHKAGIINTSPVVPCYSNSAQMSFSEVLDYMMTTRIPWPDIGHIGGPEARIETFKTLLPVVIREIAFAGEWRKMMRANLEEKLKDIGFKLFNRIPIDQAEKTFFLMYGAPGARATIGADKEEVLGTVLPALQNDRTTIQETWDLYKQSVQPGPGLHYYKLISNANIEALVYYYGPHVASLPFTVGYMRPFGQFQQPFLSRLDDISWSEADVLTAIRETSGYFIHAGVDVAMRGQLSWPQTTPFHLDLPGVDIYRTSEEDISKYDWSYVSTWRQRPVLSTE